jgi:hypothetical protein
LDSGTAVFRVRNTRRIEDDAFMTEIDVERLAKAMRMAGVRAEPEYGSLWEAANAIADDYTALAESDRVVVGHPMLHSERRREARLGRWLPVHRRLRALYWAFDPPSHGWLRVVWGFYLRRLP